jgi:hypothetical protein
VHNLNYATSRLNVAMENSRKILDLGGDAAGTEGATIDP